jgi:hypothetical protein
MTHLVAYYFQGRSMPLMPYITLLSPSKGDCWREDWVIVQIDFHDRLELPTGAPIGKRDLWEKVPDL